jgi:cytosine/adenosine deaminase-related metal-dependent hydrolase
VTDTDAPVDLLIRDAAWVVTLAGPDLPGGWVACSAGRVVGVGGAGSEPSATEVLDAHGGLVTPGLVNAHHHLFQNLTRAHADTSGEGLEGWLRALRPVWAAGLDEETAYLSAWVGLADLALSGCTTTADHPYLHPRPGLVDAELRAAREIGLRLDPCRGFIDAAVLDVEGAESLDDVLADAQRLLEEWHDPAPDSMTRISVGPTSLAAVTTASLSTLAELVAPYDARLHVHLFEEAVEAERSRVLHGAEPVAVLAEAGWSHRSWIAHGNHLTGTEAGALAAAGIGVAHCPSSNLLLGGPPARVPMLRTAGCTVGIGTDGSASAGTSALWLEARTALLLARMDAGPAGFSARDALALATVGAAACLGRAGEIGALAPGLQADLVVWDITGPSYAGAVTDPVETWIRCGPARARHTVVGGRPVVRDGVLLAPGLEHVLAAHERHARAWQEAGAPSEGETS